MKSTNWNYCFCRIDSNPIGCGFVTWFVGQRSDGDNRQRRRRRGEREWNKRQITSKSNLASLSRICLFVYAAGTRETITSIDMLMIAFRNNHNLRLKWMEMVRLCWRMVWVRRDFLDSIPCRCRNERSTPFHSPAGRTTGRVCECEPSRLRLFSYGRHKIVIIRNFLTISLLTAFHRLFFLLTLIDTIRHSHCRSPLNLAMCACVCAVGPLHFFCSWFSSREDDGAYVRRHYTQIHARNARTDAWGERAWTTNTSVFVYRLFFYFIFIFSSLVFSSSEVHYVCLCVYYVVLTHTHTCSVWRWTSKLY